MAKVLSINKRSKHFKEVLQEIQEYLASKHSLFNLNDKEAEAKQLKNYISKYIFDKNYEVRGFTTQELIDKIYQEMAEFGFLTSYLFSKEVEVININSWVDIKVKMSNGQEIQTKETFNSPSHALDIISRLLQTSDMILDYSSPMVRGHLLTAGNIRITAFAPPVVDKEIGVAS